MAAAEGQDKGDDAKKQGTRLVVSALHMLNDSRMLYICHT